MRHSRRRDHTLAVELVVLVIIVVVVVVQIGDGREPDHGRSLPAAHEPETAARAAMFSDGVKAIQIDRHGGPEELHVVDLPTPEPGPGQVRIKQSVAGLNFIDIYLRTGLYPAPLPFVLGREGAGVVDAVGPDVTTAAVGDRVAYMSGSTPGGYADYAVVRAADAVPIPAGVDDRTACAAMLQGVTAQYLCTSTYPVRAGETVLVHAAAGGVGLLLVQLAKRAGATVIATAGGAEKGALVKGAGADHVIDYATTDFAPVVKELTAGRGVAVAYDSVGKDTWERSMSVLAKRGYLVLYGASSGPVPAIEPQRLAAAGSIFLTRPTLVDYILTRDELLGRTDDLFDAIAGGRLTLRIGATYPLAEAAQAQRDLAARRTTGKVLLTL